MSTRSLLRGPGGRAGPRGARSRRAPWWCLLVAALAFALPAPASARWSHRPDLFTPLYNHTTFVPTFLFHSRQLHLQDFGQPDSDLASGATRDLYDSIVLSPDGRNLYVSSLHDEAVFSLQRDEQRGSLSLIGTHKGVIVDVPQDGQPLHLVAAGYPVKGALRISRDGRHLYASSFNGTRPAVWAFERDPETGMLGEPVLFESPLSEEHGYNVTISSSIELSMDDRFLIVAHGERVDPSICLPAVYTTGTNFYFFHRDPAASLDAHLSQAHVQFIDAPLTSLAAARSSLNQPFFYSSESSMTVELSQDEQPVPVCVFNASEALFMPWSFDTEDNEFTRSSNLKTAVASGCHWDTGNCYYGQLRSSPDGSFIYAIAQTPTHFFTHIIVVLKHTDEGEPLQEIQRMRAEPLENPMVQDRTARLEHAAELLQNGSFWQYESNLYLTATPRVKDICVSERFLFASVEAVDPILSSYGDIISERDRTDNPNLSRGQPGSGGGFAALRAALQSQKRSSASRRAGHGNKFRTQRIGEQARQRNAKARDYLFVYHRDPTTGMLSLDSFIPLQTRITSIACSDSNAYALDGWGVRVYEQEPLEGPLPLLGYPHTTADKGVAISPVLPILADGAVPSLSALFTVQPPLPHGLQIDPQSGVIDGLIPTESTEEPGSRTFVVSMSDGLQTAHAAFVLTVRKQLVQCSYFPAEVNATVGELFEAGPPLVTSGLSGGFEVIDGTVLPTGLALDPSTGHITGVPYLRGDHNVVILCDPKHGEVTTLAIHVREAPISITGYTSNPATHRVGSDIPLNVPIVEGPVSSFEVDLDTPLPDGLSLDPVLGVLFGHAQEVSSKTCIVHAQNADHESSISLIIEAFDPTPLEGLEYREPFATYTVGVPITPNSASIRKGGSQNVVFSISAPLPQGLNFDSATGLIDGTPQVPSRRAAYYIEARIISLNFSLGTTLTLEILHAPLNTRFSSVAQTYVVNQSIVENHLIQLAEELSISPALPAGLEIQEGERISGTPETARETTLYSVAARNAERLSLSSLLITIARPPPSGLAYNGVQAVYPLGEAIAPLVPSYAGHADMFEVQPPLPEGLQLDPASGHIFGTPLRPQRRAVFDITARSSSGSSGVQIVFEIAERAPEPFSYVHDGPITVLIRSPFGPFVPNVSTSMPPVRYSVVPALPMGIDIEPATGIIAGTPLVVTRSTTTFNVTASNTGGLQTTSFQLRVRFPVIENPISLVYELREMVLRVNRTAANNRPTTMPVTPEDYVPGAPVCEVSDQPLPLGMLFNTTTGAFEGVPQEVWPRTQYNVVCHGEPATLFLTVLNAAPGGVSYNATRARYTVESAIESNHLVRDESAGPAGGPASGFSIVPPPPLGLEFNTSNGILSGTPLSASEPALFAVEIANDGGSYATHLHIEVADRDVPLLRYASAEVRLLNGSVNIPAPDTGNATGLVFTIAPSLPQGLHLDTATGAVTGTALMPVPNVTFVVTASSQSDSRTTSFSLVGDEPFDNLAATSIVLTRKVEEDDEFAKLASIIALLVVFVAFLLMLICFLLYRSSESEADWAAVEEDLLQGNLSEDDEGVKASMASVAPKVGEAEGQVVTLGPTAGGSAPVGEQA